MHILLVVGKFPDLTFIFRTATGLVARGHQVTVAARQRGDWKAFQDQLPLPDTLQVRYLLPDTGLANPIQALRAIIGLVRLSVGSPRAMWRLAQLIRQHSDIDLEAWRKFIRYAPLVGLKPDVIQFDFPMTANAFRLLSILCYAPTVVSCRGADIHMLDQRDPVEYNQRLAALHQATAIHCVSAEMAAEVTRVSGRTTGLWVNRPAIPITDIKPKTEYGNDHPPLLVSVGRLTWKKGLDYLLAALARLKQAGVPFRAQIIGDGELYSVLRFSIEDMGLLPEVELAGKLPAAQVLDRLRQADIFVLSSHEEGISNAVLEAMAVGLPVVTTAAGGMAEAVRDGIDGFVIPVRDIRTLTDRLNCLLINPDLRKQMGQAARARVVADFSLERQAAIFEQIYQSITSDPDAAQHSA